MRIWLFSPRRRQIQDYQVALEREREVDRVLHDQEQVTLSNIAQGSCIPIVAQPTTPDYCSAVHSCAMMDDLEFAWDPAKDASNLIKHGITFAEAAQVFDDPHLIVDDTTKPEHQETRQRAVGKLESRYIAVIFTERGDYRRIISARRARIDEQRRYDQGKTTR